MRKRIIRISGNPRLMTYFILGRPLPKPLSWENPMFAAYPLHLEREIDRRWLHRLMPIDRPMPLDRPKHPNDIRPLSKRSDDRTDPLRKSDLPEIDRDEQKPGRRERDRHLMEF